MKSSGEVKLFMGILIVAILLVGVAVYPTIIHKTQDPPFNPYPPAPKEATLEVLTPKGSHVRGNPAAPYTLVEFGDYQCSHCRESGAIVEKLMSQYKDKLKLIYHHCQISPAHPNEPILAHAAEVAGEQGKFWEMHDQIFENQKQFDGADMPKILDALTKIAGKANLDVLRFRQGMANGDNSAFERDQQLSKTVNITTTPTFFVVPSSGKVTQISGTTALEDWFRKNALQ